MSAGARERWEKGVAERRREQSRRTSTTTLVNLALSLYGEARRRSGEARSLENILRKSVESVCRGAGDQKVDGVYAEAKRLLALSPRRNPRDFYVHDRFLGEFLDFGNLKTAARYADKRFGCRPAGECVFIEQDETYIPVGQARPHIAKRIPALRNPLPNEHSARLINPSDVVKGSYRRRNVKGGTIGLLFARVRGAKGPRGGSMQLASVHFRAANFTPSQARAWMRDHDLSPILFEAATSSRKEAWKSEAPRSKRAASRRRRDSGRYRRTA